MALRTAKAFKNFLIDSNLSQGVFFGMDTPIDISVKCDNFAEQVQVYNVIEAINLFEYKYITFDGKTVFEITDCLQCDDYYTLFVTLLSRVKLEQWDSDFLLTHQTYKKLKDLGFDNTKWIEILGSEIKFEQIAGEAMGWGIKIDLSAIPSNIGVYDYDNNTPEFINWAASLHGLGFLTHTDIAPRDPAIGSTLDYNYFVASQRSYTVILPVPIGNSSQFEVTETSTSGTAKTFLKTLNWYDFMRALEALINDLTLSVELIPLSFTNPTVGILTRPATYTTGTLPNFRGGGGQLSTNNSIKYSFSYNKPNLYYVQKYWLQGGLACIVKDIAAQKVDYPFMFCEFGIGSPTPTSAMVGFVVNYNFISISAPTSNSIAITAINLLGNVIEVNGKLADTLYIKIKEHGLRVYLNWELRNFVDIENNIEFDKSAFSNFEAYQKANLLLVQNQQTETLKLQQQQAEKTQTLNQVQAGVGALSKAGQAGANAAMGGPFAAIGAAASSLVSSATDMVFNQISFNQKQQNERANLKLQQQQALGALRSTIVPATTLNGFVVLSDIVNFRMGEFGRPPLVSSIYFTYVNITGFRDIKLYDYLISNNYLDNIDNGYLTVPPYVPAGKPVQCMFTASPITNNKSFVALCKPLPQS